MTVFICSDIIMVTTTSMLALEWSCSRVAGLTFFYFQDLKMDSDSNDAIEIKSDTDSNNAGGVQ